MSTTGERLKEERLRLGYNQTNFAQLAGVTKNSQINYENNTRHPDTLYLRAINRVGADINYIVTGNRSSDTNESILTQVENQKVLDTLKFLRKEIDQAIDQLRREK